MRRPLRPRALSVLVALVLASAAFGCGRPHVLVVGLDGANWAVLDPLIDAGYLPNIGHLVRSGASAGLDCTPADPVAPCFCPPVWTSIATGVTRAQHRIVNLFDPVSKRARKAIWNVLEEHGGIVTLVSYRATWPPEPDVQFVFTEPGLDAAGESLYDVWLPSDHPGLDQPDTWFQPPGILERLGVLPGNGVHPPSWGIFARDRAAMEGLLQLSLARGLPDPWDRSTELTMMILHGPDKVEHLMWGSVQDEMYGPFDTDALLAQAAAYDGPVLEPGPFGWGQIADPYLEADAWLGRLLLTRSYDYVVFVSDHGMTRNPNPGLAGQHDVASTEGHMGILSIHGMGVREGAWLGTVSVLDVAPTLAYLLDLPVALDLPGRVLREAFTPERLERRPAYAKTVMTWE